MLNQVSIPRQVVTLQVIYLAIQGFCDASERAFVACLYLTVMNQQGHFTTRLLCVISRIVPVKLISLPKLKLCGALSIYLWSEREPTTWKVFVANRISELQQATQLDEWQHIRLESTAANMLSRRVNTENLAQSNLWWHVSEFLSQKSEFWPNAI